MCLCAWKQNRAIKTILSKAKILKLGNKLISSVNIIWTNKFCRIKRYLICIISFTRFARRCKRISLHYGHKNICNTRILPAINQLKDTKKSIPSSLYTTLNVNQRARQWGINFKWHEQSSSFNGNNPPTNWQIRKKQTIKRHRYNPTSKSVFTLQC